MARFRSKSLHASAAETADLSGAGVTFEPAEVALVLDITAVSGTNPTLDVTVEEYDKTADAWLLLDTFPQETGVAVVRRAVTGPVGNRLRCSWAITGTDTPTFTFSLTAKGKEQR